MSSTLKRTAMIEDQIEALQFYNKNDIRSIRIIRKYCEYRRKLFSNSKEDLLNCIQCKMDLLSLITKPKDKNGFVKKTNNRKNLHERKQKLRHMIIKRINKLFKIALQKFPSDCKIWLLYINFCKETKLYLCVSRMLAQMLQFHNGKPPLYQLAARWEFEVCHSIESARKYIHQGLQVHKDSKLLYTEGFRLELAYANQMLERLEDKGEVLKKSTEAVIKCELAEVFYESALMKIKDVFFYVELLRIAHEYKFTSNLQDKIIEGMRTKFPNEEETWNTLARRELELGGTVKERIEKCIEAYKTGLKRVPTRKMWSLYLEYILEINEDLTTLPNFKQNCLKETFQTADSVHMLTEKHYVSWVNKVSDVDAFKVLKWATDRLRDSTKLWTLRIHYHLSHGYEKRALALLNEVISSTEVQDKVGLCHLVLMYYQITDPCKSEYMWRVNLSNPIVGFKLKHHYIEFLAVTKGILAARKAYEELSTSEPYSLELHVIMAKFEDAQPKLNISQVRTIYENAVTQFGEYNSDVWLWYVKFEQKYGDPEKIMKVFYQAQKLLKPYLLDDFTTNFQLHMSKTEQVIEKS